MIRENLKMVHERIRQACLSCGRNPQEVTLVAVSKTKPVEMLMEAYGAGERIFGENKVQEILEKKSLMPSDVSWQMIGHLQRNKVKSAVANASRIHSVDSLRLAQAISQESEKLGIVMPVLVEVNVAGEESKYGISVEETENLVWQMSKLGNLQVEGLMTIAPFVDDPEQNRSVFRTLKQLSEEIEKRGYEGVRMNELSMGMTNDFEVAIQEGSTFVRVGTGIFGERAYGLENG